MMIEGVNLRKTYLQGSRSVVALDGVSLQLAAGERVAIMGRSGSGKSTLLQLLGALDRPDSGTIRIAGSEIGSLSDRDLSRFRRRRLGFIFQSFNLLPTLTALENAAWPLLLDGRDRKSSFATAKALLEQMGLGHRGGHYPAELSGGEMQRIAIARALSAAPALILADEPTGNLDSASGETILGILTRSVASTGGALLMVTHDPKAAAHCDRVIQLKDGKIEVNA